MVEGACGVGISYSSSEIRFSHLFAKYPTHLRPNYRQSAQAAVFRVPAPLFHLQLTMAVGKVSRDLPSICTVADSPRMFTEQASLQG